MNLYQCHKRVKAAQITEVFPVDEPSHVKLILEDGVTFYAGGPLYMRYAPQVGDYLVEYEDGYQSISPQKAFEEGYAKVVDKAFPGDTFGWAVKELQNGSLVTRAGWNGKGMWLALQVPDANSKMSRPYIYMKTADDKLVPWVASQSDILAVDWEIAPSQ